MKKLNVPFIASLDNHDLSEASKIMELNATRESIDTLNWKEEFPYKPIVIFDIARGKEALYIHYFVRGLSIKALADKDGNFVHEDSCVEFFMRKADQMNYINFEFNCIGTCYAAHHETREKSIPFTMDEYRSIRRYTTIQSEAFAEQKGIHAWELTVAIPFKLMGIDPENLPDMIRGNFYKCADGTENPHYTTWSPINLPKPNYHYPDFFGEIYL